MTGAAVARALVVRGLEVVACDDRLDAAKAAAAAGLGIELVSEPSAEPTQSIGAGLGRYRLIASLGHGGMADVFLGVAEGPVGFSKLQVIKRLRPNLAEDPELLTLFLDEARLAARLNHPNVVQTNEVGEQGGGYFIAMEYLDGQPLNRILQRAASAGAARLPVLLRVLADALMQAGDRRGERAALAESAAAYTRAEDLARTQGDPLLPYLPRLPDAMGPVVARAGRLTNENFAAERIPGPASQGLVGDYFMANDRIRVVVQQPGRAMGPLPYGGNIIDMDFVDQPVGDSFGKGKG